MAGSVAARLPRGIGAGVESGLISRVHPRVEARRDGPAPPRAPLLGMAEANDSRLAQALATAQRLHGAQKRKGTDIPYVAHLIAVAGLVLEGGGDEDAAVAALLHDAVEDAGGPPTLAAIRAQFGEHVADVVAACSDTDEEPKPPWRARKQAYLDHLRSDDLPDGALLVSLADKLHNARAIGADLRAHGAALWRRL